MKNQNSSNIMKLKFLLSIISLSTLFLISCQNESIKCDGELVKKTVISILKDEALKQKVIAKRNLGIGESYLNRFFDKNIKLYSVRTHSKDEELNLCQCSAELGLNLQRNVIDFAKDNISGNGNDLQFAKERISNILSMRINIEYEVQEVSNDFLVETSVPSDLGKLLGASFYFENQFEKHKLVGKVLTYNDSRGEGGVYTLEYFNDNKVKITYQHFDYSFTKILTFRVNPLEIINESEWKEYELIGDELVVDGKEGKVRYKLD